MSKKRRYGILTWYMTLTLAFGLALTGCGQKAAADKAEQENFFDDFENAEETEVSDETPDLEKEEDATEVAQAETGGAVNHAKQLLQNADSGKDGKNKRPADSEKKDYGKKKDSQDVAQNEPVQDEMQDAPTQTQPNPEPVKEEPQSPAPAATSAASASLKTYGSLYFDTTDLNGNAVSTGTFSGAKVVMLNFWEPWCGPCVREMPDLEKLYQNYKGQGLQIVGSFSTIGEDDYVWDMVRKTGVTYPIVRTEGDMFSQMTGYVPTTIFLDGSGNILSAEPIIGSKSYANWEAEIKKYLGL